MSTDKEQAIGNAYLQCPGCGGLITTSGCAHRLDCPNKRAMEDDKLVSDAKNFGYLCALDELTNFIRGNSDLYPVAVKIADMRRAHAAKKHR